MLKSDVLRAVRMGFACFLAAFLALNAQAVNFQAGAYTPYSGDYNQDGLPDLLLEPQQKFVFVSVGDVSVPITITQPYVILLQQSDGSYQLLIHQDKAAFNQIARQPAAYATLLSDLNGDGRPDLLLQPQQDSQATLVLYSRAEKLAAGLHLVDATALDLSFSSAVTRVETTDLNGDGRQDLLLIQDNTSLSKFLIVPSILFPGI